MKLTSSNQTETGVIKMNASQIRHGFKPLVDADMAIKEIHQRAEHVGSVLEEILRVGHKCANSDKRV
jgi:hypothetical protein